MCDQKRVTWMSDEAVDKMCQENLDMKSYINRVREVHLPIKHDEYWEQTGCCEELVCTADLEDYPCPTIEALDGETE